jgi:competence protein ComFB
MAIRNIMEDLVSSVVHEVLSKEQEAAHPEIYFDDIVAYVLNRIPPRYVTSERGILHDRIDFSRSAQQKSDILFLTHEALGYIASRRSLKTTPAKTAEEKLDRFFPHLLGEVLEETTFNSVAGIEVLLLYKGKPALMIDPQWPNPYRTIKATRGFYHFWPKFIHEEMSDVESVEFLLRFSHPSLEDAEVGLSLRVVQSFNFGNSQVLPIMLMKTKEGIDVSSIFDTD